MRQQDGGDDEGSARQDGGDVEGGFVAEGSVSDADCEYTV